jgi:hypothetical protein
LILPKIFISTGVLLPFASFFVMSEDKDSFILPYSYCLQEMNDNCLSKLTLFDSLSLSVILILLGLWLNYSSKMIVSKADLPKK